MASVNDDFEFAGENSGNSGVTDMVNQKDGASPVKEIMGEVIEKAQDARTENAAIGKEAQGKTEYNREEITLKFGKGLVGDEFTGKDGNSYRQILIPNADPEDRSPWKSFVLKSNQVHESKFSKGMWCKLPADGQTTVRQSTIVGRDDQGNAIWEHNDQKVPNKELKAMVESYKTRNREQAQSNERSQVPMKDRIAHKQEVAAAQNKQTTAAKTAVRADIKQPAI